LYAATIILI